MHAATFVADCRWFGARLDSTRRVEMREEHRFVTVRCRVALMVGVTEAERRWFGARHTLPVAFVRHCGTCLLWLCNLS